MIIRIKDWLMECCNNNGCSGTTAVPDAARPPVVDGAEQAVFLIQNMDCPTEEKLIRDRLEKMPGVAALQFNLMLRELTVRHRLPAVAPIADALTSLGMEAVVKTDTLNNAAPGHDFELAQDAGLSGRAWAMLCVSGAAVGAEMLAWWYRPRAIMGGGGARRYRYPFWWFGHSEKGLDRVAVSVAQHEFPDVAGGDWCCGDRSMARGRDGDFSSRLRR
jgi:copper chaperone CopZ